MKAKTTKSKASKVRSVSAKSKTVKNKTTTTKPKAVKKNTRPTLRKRLHLHLQRVNSKGFAFISVSAVFIITAVFGSAYLALAGTAQFGTGSIMSDLYSGKKQLCLNVPSQKAANDTPIHVTSCIYARGAQTWSIKPLANNNFAIQYDNTNYCIGVNAPNGQLALTPQQAKKDQQKDPKHQKRNVVTDPYAQLFGCRDNQKSFNNSFQQWKLQNSKIINVNKMAVFNKLPMCLTIFTAARPIHLAACNNPKLSPKPQIWTLPQKKNLTVKINPAQVGLTSGTGRNSTAKVNLSLVNALSCVGTITPKSSFMGIWNGRRWAPSSNNESRSVVIGPFKNISSSTVYTLTLKCNGTSSNTQQASIKVTVKPYNNGGGSGGGNQGHGQVSITSISMSPATLWSNNARSNLYHDEAKVAFKVTGSNECKVNGSNITPSFITTHWFNPSPNAGVNPFNVGPYAAPSGSYKEYSLTIDCRGGANNNQYVSRSIRYKVLKYTYNKIN